MLSPACSQSQTACMQHVCDVLCSCHPPTVQMHEQIYDPRISSFASLLFQSTEAQVFQMTNLTDASVSAVGSAAHGKHDMP